MELRAQSLWSCLAFRDSSRSMSRSSRIAAALPRVATAVSGGPPVQPDFLELAWWCRGAVKALKIPCKAAAMLVSGLGAPINIIQTIADHNCSIVSKKVIG